MRNVCFPPARPIPMALCMAPCGSNFPPGAGLLPEGPWTRNSTRFCLSEPPSFYLPIRAVSSWGREILADRFPPFEQMTDPPHRFPGGPILAGAGCPSQPRSVHGPLSPQWLLRPACPSNVF